jgi:Na+/melibiose symporter-like transporter
MLAFGLSDSEIGLVASVGLACQVVWTLLSGASTDKLGRKRTTLIFDLISWSLPCLIWAFAQDLRWFIIAAVANSVWRVTNTSWQCLLVEDTDPDLLVDVWSWISISGLVAAFIAPLTGLMIARFSLIPTMRGLYLLAFVMMTAKFITTNAIVTETEHGRRRMQETRGQPLLAVLKGSGEVLGQIVRTPATLLVGGLILVLNIYLTIRGTFWSILVTEKLFIPTERLALYTLARSVTMLAFFFLVMPRLRSVDVRRPMMVGFAGLIASQALLLAVPPRNEALLLLAVILEACCTPLANTLLSKLVAITVDAGERARTMALLWAVVIVGNSPFGWIAGRLSEIQRSLPFVLNAFLLTVGLVLAVAALRTQAKEGSPVPPKDAPL